MKKISLSCVSVFTMLACSGCISTSISESLTLIERENRITAKRTVNKSVLNSIQILRTSQKFEVQSKPKSYTFVYDLHNKELNYDDKIKITDLITKNNLAVVINIAPAKGTNKLHQLALSMARAEVFRLHMTPFSKRVTIKFAPKLSTDTINLVTGA